MTIVELREKAKTANDEARGLIDTITAENSADVSAKIDALEAQAEEFGKRADQLERIENRAKVYAAPASKIAGEGETVEARSNNVDDEKRSAAIASYLRGHSSEYELRSLGIATPSGGGYTVANGPMQKLVETLKYSGPMLSDRFDVQPTETGTPLPWPTTNDTGNVAPVVAEAGSVPEQDAAFGTVMIGAVKYAQMLKVSSEFLSDSSIPVEDYVVKALGTRIGRAANAGLTAKFITGSATGKTVASATAIAWKELLDLEYSLDIAYHDNCVYMMHALTVGAFRGLTDSTGRPLWQDSTQAGQPALLNGKPVLINNAMDTIGAGKKSVAYFDPSAFTVRRVKDISVRRLNERYADNDLVGFMGTLRADGAITDGAASRLLVHP